VNRLVVQQVPAGGVVTVRCVRGGGRCPFKSKTFKSRRTVTLTKFFRRKLRPRTMLEVGITADRRIGRVLQYKVRKAPFGPAKKTLCEPPGSPKPLPCE
jgi:hypothetical protein